MNPYYWNVEEYIPQYYYYSPYQDQQQTLKRKLTNTKEVSTQTQMQEDFLSQIKDHKVANNKSLQDLLDADVSVIQENKEPLIEQIELYGNVCLPALSLYINSCKIEVICSQIGRISCEILYIPFFGNDLSIYRGIIFTNETQVEIKRKFYMAHSSSVEILFLKSHFTSKFAVLALHSLRSPREDYIKGVKNILLSGQRLDKKKSHQLMIPFEGFQGCEKEFVQTVVGFVQIQKRVSFRHIVLNCSKFEYYERVCRQMMNIMSILSRKGELIV